ncbi:cob(I)yrinic acid a,c-diamide adenosyltransferase [Halanaerobium hydrogeniformans]|uniref:ATP:corrinoid adenosyltransferase BtuR/CobO/CobP n=1 Tax=Halanaerobium hydrogeniformans TaxID=656519 RepID=E4RKA3_HALHG|nr:cob(I)yrinic acid a,c-diamide adenosyltransferase [Halanaerobium hydrogeniformans]ADQ15616.1 ATP:corrinoid adenosyltransferase BtuR/CobO/CobP [Halanaerobium hydrogeniformans]
MKAMVHVYTGCGKGKTTAALGLALRAIGADKKVFVAQFVKGMQYSELKSISKIENIGLKQYGHNYFIKGKSSKKDKTAARQGLKEVEELLEKGEYDLIILDEANIAVHYNLFSVGELITVLEKSRENIEIVITGRYAAEELIEYADLVTEMKEIKHYFKKGIKARKGIEK